MAMAGVLLAGSVAFGAGTRVEGTITAIDAEALQLVVADTSVQVTALTVIQKNGRAITFDDLVVGLTVAACGTLDEDGVLIANRVTVKLCQPIPVPLVAGAAAGVQIVGEIAAIDADLQQIVVGETTIEVTADTIIKKNGRVITFDDLGVGQTVAACGAYDADGVLIAKRITVRLQAR
jgi:hypothetical protein